MPPLPPTSDLDISSLDLVQRILVTTDGTLTDMSEDAILIERSYRTFTGGAPVFEVTEFFPLEYARQRSLRPNQRDPRARVGDRST